MNILRAIFLRLCKSFLPGALFLFLLLFSLKTVMGTPTHLESAADKSGVYNVMVSGLLLQNAHMSVANLPLSDPGIIQAINSAFPPSLIRQTSNKVIDGTYLWIDGTSPTLQFSVDLSDAKYQAADNIGAYVAARVANLPACTASELRTINLSNPYTLTCRPANTGIVPIQVQVRNMILGSNDLLQGTVLKASSFKDAGGQTLSERLKVVPRVYKFVVQGLYELGIVSLVAALGIIFLSKSRRAGIKRVCIVGLSIAISSGILALLSSWFANLVVKQAEHGSGGGTTLLQIKALRIGSLLVNDIHVVWIELALILGITSIVGLVWVRIDRKRREEEIGRTGIDGANTAGFTV